MSKQLKFRVKYIVLDNDCWQWQCAKNAKGYGQIYDWKNKTTIKAHRLFYENKFGKIPEGMTINHKCKNPSCVNPDHMELMTNSDNIKLMQKERNDKDKRKIRYVGKVLMRVRPC